MALCYSVEAVTDADYADDLALLVNTTGQPNPYCIAWPPRERKQSGRPLKFVKKFTYLGSNISSTESDVNIRLTKA